MGYHNVLCQNDPIELKDEMAVATFGGLTSSLYLLHSSNMAGDGPPRSPICPCAPLPGVLSQPSGEEALSMYIKNPKRVP